jgi:CRP-like cAMP-binding protein
MTSPTLEPLLRKLEYRGEFSAEDRAALLALPHAVKSFASQTYIVREGDKPTHCCLMLSGFSVRDKIVRSGHRQIVAIQVQGEMVDLQNSLLGTADCGVQMVTAGQVAMIPKEEIVRIATERLAIGKAMWIDTLVDGSISREWTTNIGRRNARTRLAHFLCEIGLRLKHAGVGEETGYLLPMTQEQLGDAAGLTPVHINRTIKALEEEGLITRTSARGIKIGDWRKLADVADFDGTYLHLNKEHSVLKGFNSA